MRLDIAFSGFAPDLDPTTPGILTSLSKVMPVANGLAPFRAAVSAGLEALPAACIGAAAVRKADDSPRFIAGTAARLYEGSGATYTNITRAVGGDYATGVDGKWRFSQFGNITFAMNKADATQYSESSNFADVGNNCPKAALGVTCAGFLLLFDYNDGVDDFGDGWFTSPLQNPLGDWTPSIATGAQKGRLTETPGKIRAARVIGPRQVVAYKERSMYLGTYQGPLWLWELISDEIGAVSQEAVAVVPLQGSPAHVFAGFDDLYTYDGTRPRSIGDPLRNWYRNNSLGNIPATYRHKIQIAIDRANGNANFVLPDSSGALAILLPFNYYRELFGYGLIGFNAEAAVEYISGAITYDTLGDFYNTFNSLPTNISYDSPFWTAAATFPALFNSSHVLQTLSGSPTGLQSTLTTNAFGDDIGYRTLTRVTPRFNLFWQPESGVGNVTYMTPSGITTAGAFTMSNGKFDLMISAKWFQASLILTGDYIITGGAAEYEEDGEE